MAHRTAMFDPAPARATDDTLLRLRCDSQSACFYTDISHFIARRLKGALRLSLLDVGPRTGAGTALLRLIHHPDAFTRIKFDPVCGIDIDPAFEHVAKIEFPDIEARTGDIAGLASKSWDMVVCSHTIEHVAATEAFIAELTRVARRYVVLACPFEEKDLIPGHVRSIGHGLLSGLGFDDIEVYESHHWHNGLCCIAMRTLEA